MTRLAAAIFWESTAENVVGGAAAGAAAVLAPHVTDLFTSIPWAQAGSGAAVGAILALLVALGSLRTPNGTASYNPQVVAEPKAPT